MKTDQTSPADQPASTAWMSSDEEERQQPEPKRWTAAEAAVLRQRQPALSPWVVVAWQLGVGALIALVAWAASGESNVAWSALYGALCVALPAAVLARGLTSPLGKMGAVSSAMGFMVWEMVKIGLSIAMLMLAPTVVQALSWLALLIGLILTMKVYWLAAVFIPKPKQQPA